MAPGAATLAVKAVREWFNRDRQFANAEEPAFAAITTNNSEQAGRYLISAGGKRPELLERKPSVGLLALPSPRI
jgi:hypothetical protein